MNSSCDRFAMQARSGGITNDLDADGLLTIRLGGRHFSSLSFGSQHDHLIP